MKKILLIIALSLFSFIQIQAQNGVAFNTTGAAPDASAIIDASSTTQGILIPRVDISDLSTAAPVASPATSLMVYNSNATTGPGFFYWDGSAWVGVGSGSSVQEINNLSDGKTDYGGEESVYLGKNAGQAATGGGIWDGKYNVVMGVDAFKTTVGGHESVAIGYKALELGATSTRNTAVGYLALQANSSSANTAIGSQSLQNATGGENTALGNFSLTTINTGSKNTSLGYYSGHGLATGNQNTFIGSSSGASQTGGDNNIALGYSVNLASLTGNNQMNIGDIIYGSNVYNATGNIGIGNGNNAPDASAVLDVASTTAGLLIPRMTAAQKTAIGTPATGLMIYQTDNTPGFYHYDGTNWVANGSTTAVGINDLTDASSTSNNLYLGLGAGAGSGTYNTATGLNAMKVNTSGGLNSAFGNNALLANTTGSEIVAIGAQSLINNTTGNKNIGIGFSTGNSITSGDENIIIGHNTDASGNASNELNIGNTIYATGVYGTSAKVGIGNGNNTPTSTLDIKGSVTKSLVTKSGSYTVSDNDYTIIITANATITLPNANTCTGREYVIRSTYASGAVTINGGGSNIMYYNTSATTMDLGVYVTHAGHGHTAVDINVKVVSVVLQSDGTKWMVTSDHSFSDQ